MTRPIVERVEKGRAAQRPSCTLTLLPVLRRPVAISLEEFQNAENPPPDWDVEWERKWGGTALAQSNQRRIWLDKTESHPFEKAADNTGVL
jgi:hypothetical protein